MYRLWKWILMVFYRDIRLNGDACVGEDQAVILAANHVNGLVDPFVISAALKRPMLFTAKASLAKNPFLRFIAAALSVIFFQRPEAHRLQEARQYNAKAIEKCLEVLSNRRSLCIFPEGKSHSDPGMKPFKTGVARIAANYLETYGNRPPLLIVPVGLNYERKYAFRSSITVTLGEPIELRDAAAILDKAGAKQLTLLLEDRVRAVTTNFARVRDSILIPWAAELYLQNSLAPMALGLEVHDPENRVAVINRFIKVYGELKQDPHVQRLEKRVYALRQRLLRNGLSVTELHLPIKLLQAAFFCFREFELFLLGLPVWLVGVCGHFAPLALVTGVVKAVTKDQDHWATHALFLGFPVFVIYYLALFLVIMVVDWRFVWVPLVVMPFSGYVALLYTDRMKQMLRRCRTFVTYLRHPDMHATLKAEAEAILHDIKQIQKRQKI